MAAIPINLTIPANKNLADKALLGFLEIHPNLTADPTSPTYLPPNPPSRPNPGMDDEDWMEQWTRDVLNAEINRGETAIFTRENPTPPTDPDIVE